MEPDPAMTSLPSPPALVHLPIGLAVSSPLVALGAALEARAASRACAKGAPAGIANPFCEVRD